MSKKNDEQRGPQLSQPQKNTPNEPQLSFQHKPLQEGFARMQKDGYVLCEFSLSSVQFSNREESRTVYSADGRGFLARGPVMLVVAWRDAKQPPPVLYEHGRVLESPHYFRGVYSITFVFYPSSKIVFEWVDDNKHMVFNVKDM